MVLHGKVEKIMHQQANINPLEAAKPKLSVHVPEMIYPSEATPSSPRTLQNKLRPPNESSRAQGSPRSGRGKNTA